jgi:D-arginine dehydrogenase
MNADVCVPSESSSPQVIVIGSGIAGASVAYALTQRRLRVLILERESQPGYHSTGRSAAHWISSYGPPGVRALTLASRSFLLNPPEGFCEVPLMRPRATMEVAVPGQEHLLEAAWQVARATTPNGAALLSAEETIARVSVLQADRVAGAVWQPDAFDIDVNALHQGFLRVARRQGATLRTDAEVIAIERDSDTGSDSGHAWHLTLRDGTQLEAPVIVNAAGAWCDVLAHMAGVAPIGLQPRRRTAFTFAPPAGVATQDWPLVAAVDESWYFKPDAGMLLGSPANADPVEPQDVQPDEMDVAIAIDALETATTMEVHPRRPWAGLRSFTAEGELVIRMAEDAPGFFWLAGQGGYGIQTSPAASQEAATLICGWLR